MSEKLTMFIHGGCASRDILNFDNVSNPKFNLVSYHARTSLATLDESNILKKVPKKYYSLLSNIESKFQRRMVEYDFKNRALSSAQEMNYDLILIDFLVGRFHLAEVQGKLITRSADFMRSGIKVDRVVDQFSNEYFYYWCNGVNNFFNVIEKGVGLEAIRINKVYWSDTATDPNDTIVLKQKWNVDRNNDRLNTMYDFVEKLLPRSCIIETPKKLLVANSNHKWGFAPFHYVDEYYEFMLNQLLCTGEK